MLSDFEEHHVFIVFTSSPTSGGPAGRVLGPYHSVRFGAKGIWACMKNSAEPVRVATQAISSLCWELDGFEDPLWGTVQVISPPAGTSSIDLQKAIVSWIRP
jgi:hypothetical protein